MDSARFRRGEAEARLSAQVVEFCALLRREHGFRLGVAETRDALRALDAVGATEQRPFRSGLRAVLCGRYEDLEPFERAFDAFFLTPQGIASDYRPRHSRPDEGEESEEPAFAVRRREVDQPSEGASWEALLAKYSPAASRGEPPELALHEVGSLLRLASALIASVRLGRSRRWRPLPGGSRFDLRRTLRASLHTGGEPLYLRRLGHPSRNPRFVVLVDGSRSMSEHGARILTFAYALLRRTTRARVFVFSTQIREITRELRRGALPELGEAWGGGTRIGDALRTFVREFGAVLDDDTVSLVFSDGLDFGEPKVLASASAELRRRCAALVWLSPNAGLPGYAPATQGMRAVLPALSALLGSRDLHALVRVGAKL